MSAGYRYPSAVPIFYGVKCALAVFFGVLFTGFAVSGGVEFASALTAAICGLGFGFLLPDFLLRPLIRARARRIRRAIPAALDLLVLSVEAGQSLNQAIVDTSLELREAFPDLSAELAQTHLELRAGKSRSDALHQLGVRNGDPELKKLASLLIDSDRFGTSLAPALRTHVKYLRTRMRQQAQESARKVSVKLIFPVFLSDLPVCAPGDAGTRCSAYGEAVRRDDEIGKTASQKSKVKSQKSKVKSQKAKVIGSEQWEPARAFMSRFTTAAARAVIFTFDFCLLTFDF